jgi:hypothetical protein
MVRIIALPRNTRLARQKLVIDKRSSLFCCRVSQSLWRERLAHKYLKKSSLLKFCCVTSTNIASSKGIFAAATNSTNQTNKAGSTCY